MNSQLALLLGIMCAGLGGELFVKGSVDLARWARIPAGLVGATVAAFATSSPELTVAITSARARVPEISLGDALGSNVINVALILAITLLGGQIRTHRKVISRDYRMAIIGPIITAMLALDGELSAFDGSVMLMFFFVWLAFLIVDARRERNAAVQILASRDGGKALLFSILGLLSLIAAGKLIVTGAKALALTWGLSDFVVGAVIVAIGTSVPELATTIISRLRGHDEIGLGTVLGSNIFNGLLIVAVAALICPIKTDSAAVAVGVAFGLLVILASYPNKAGVIARQRGVLLLVLYVAYVVTTIY